MSPPGAGGGHTSPLPVDSLGLWEATAGLPEQVAAALDRSLAALEHPALAQGAEIRQVVATGMGGSGIAGDVLAALAAPVAAVPVTVTKGYDLPRFVGPHTLVFAISCSGDTEETLAAAGAALAAGARVVAVSAGGALGRLAADAGAPLFTVPDSIPQPRAALGAMAVPPLVVCEHLGLLPGATGWVAEAVPGLQRRRDQLVGSASPAAEVARRIGRTFPVVHGSPGLTAVAAQRWKTQVNENAKSPAFAAVQPELCHNEVAGWGQDGDVTRQIMTLVALRHRAESRQVARRFALVAEVLDEVVADTVEVWAEGDDDLSRFFDLALFGDFVSLHLAGHEGTDPGPVPVLADIKQQLRAG